MRCTIACAIVLVGVFVLAPPATWGQGKGKRVAGGGVDTRALDTLRRLADADFNMRDRNGDGFLNQDEMPADLKSELSKWDTNRDNLISLDEYRVYYVATRPQAKATLPDWLKELDTDKDGQVALYEWRKAGKDTNEFREWDRNDDGYITPDEANFKQRMDDIEKALKKLGASRSHSKTEFEALDEIRKAVEEMQRMISQF